MVLMTATWVGLAQARAKDVSAQVRPQQTEKEKIKKADLPAAAVKTLEDDTYKTWTILQVYRFKGKDAQGKEANEYGVEERQPHSSAQV